MARGTGNSKVDGNYASTMKPAADATEDGYSQVLWLFGDNDKVTEAGAIELTKWQRIIFY